MVKHYKRHDAGPWRPPDKPLIKVRKKMPASVRVYTSDEIKLYEKSK